MLFGFVIPAIALLGLLAFFAFNQDVAVLNPQGAIAEQQRNLFVFTVLLSLIVVVPVFTLLFVISWKFRAENKKATYRPDWDNNHWLEIVWWGIPVVIIVILSVITWQTSHSLDPYRPIEHDTKPIRVQVVSLQWKWLFIYPDQMVASVNELVFPEKTPIAFELTSDAPMNSFWIPQLGGQIYTMNGMSTNLHLIADKVGNYEGVSSNISGEGFSNMRFDARSVSSQDFDNWVAMASTFNRLDDKKYAELVKPSVEEAPIAFALSDNTLYDRIVMKYMVPGHGAQAKGSESGGTSYMHGVNMPEMSHP